MCQLRHHMVNMVRFVAHNLRVSNTLFVLINIITLAFFLCMFLASIPFDLYPLQMSLLTIFYSSANDEVWTPPSVGGPVLPVALSATRTMQTSSSMPTRTGKTLFCYIL